MEQNTKFYQSVLKIAVPVTLQSLLQSLLQSSFSVIDQVMIGQLGSTSITAIGLAGKFAWMYSVLLAAVATVAGIMIAQYVGKQDQMQVSRSFWMNLCMAAGLAVLFIILCICFPEKIMSIYTKDRAVKQAAVSYLQILSLSYLPMAVSQILPALLRCMGGAVLPLYAGISSVVMNTVLNYVLILGKLGFPKLGVIGAAAATVLSQTAGCLLILVLFFRFYHKQELKLMFILRLNRAAGMQYLAILMPILICECLWSLGENVYTSVYGHLGTLPCAAMTLTSPVQMLVIGSLTGLSQAAGVLIGKTLGSSDYDRAYQESKKLMQYGLAGSAILSILLLAVSRYYVQIYQVEPGVQALAIQILTVYALISPVKVQNMILGGGIVRSGGKTKYIMWIDIIGTWCFGVPLALLAGFVWKLSIPYVYLILSLEECVRYAATLVLFRKRRWMQSL